MDVGKAVQEVKAGKIDFRVDKQGIVHAAIGKVSFDARQIAENAVSAQHHPQTQTIALKEAHM